jgi:hypothetical protein
VQYCPQFVQYIHATHALSPKGSIFLRAVHILPKLLHHQPINVPTAEAQAFLWDNMQGEPTISNHAGPVLTTANSAGTNGLTCLPRHGGARDNSFGHSSNDQPTLLSCCDSTPKRTDRGDIELFKPKLLSNEYCRRGRW